MGSPWQPRRRRTKAVTLAQCSGGRCVGLFDGERMIVLTFRHAGSETDPVGLQLPEARRLISELIRVLLGYGDDYAFALSRAAWNSGVGAVATAVDDPRTCPSCQGCQGCQHSSEAVVRRPSNGPKVRPSRRAGAPKGPILATESWTLHRMLKNVKSHSDFLRFISADGADSTDAAAPSKQPHSPSKKRKPSRPLRAKRGQNRPQRKEK